MSYYTYNTFWKLLVYIIDGIVVLHGGKDTRRLFNINIPCDFLITYLSML